MKYTQILTILTSLFVAGVAHAENSTAEANNIVREEFNYTPQVEIKNLADRRGCKGGKLEYITTLNQSGEAYTVKAKIYMPDKPAEQKRSVIFMLPTIKGGQKLAGLIDRFAAFSFCRQNFIAVLLENDFTGLSTGSPLGISESDLSIRRVVAALKGGIQIATHNLNADQNKVGLFGASLGGILGSTAYGLMSEIKAGTFLVAGGDLPHILTHSDQKPIIKVKEDVMLEKGFKTDAEYEAYLNEALRFDPLDFADNIERDEVKLYLSLNDRSVPTLDQMKLYEELNRPTETSFVSRSGHAITIFRVLVFSRQKTKIGKWFKARFEE
jgi:hypothetical protein